MSLPSQSARTSARSSSVNYRRSKGSSGRKVLTAIGVIGALALILWYVLKRPTNETQLNTAGATDSSELTNNASPANDPAELSNAAPERSLPGSGSRPDPQQEIEDTIASSTGTNPLQTQPVEIQNRTPITVPNDPKDSSSLLNATRNQGNASPATTRASVPNSTPNTTTNSSTTRGSGADRVRLQLDTAQRMINQNDRVAARQLLSQTLNNPNISKSDANRVRSKLIEINEVLLFGPVVDANDPITEEYKVQSGDSLSRIASRRELATHWKLIQRVNRIANPSRIRLGQTLKLVRGPFHAVVYKSEHRMDIYNGPVSDPMSWVYITSLNVGLGEDNGTPVGTFTVSTNKLENPGWVNPRDASERYSPDDPMNPIGEYWLGLDGVGEYASLDGYGIHGTIDPGSIGGDQSMGCVRLADDDIAIVYELLVERASVVEIRP